MQKTLFIALLFGFQIILNPYLIFAKENTTPLQQLLTSSQTRADLVEKVQKAVVNIKVEKLVRTPDGQLNNPRDLFNDRFFERFFPGMKPPSRTPRNPPPQNKRPRKKQFRQEGMGTGSIITSTGYILTNHHVVGGADKIIVRLDDGTEVEAKLIGSDPEADIAVIKIEGKSLPTLPMGDSDQTRVGETVIAIGNPFGLVQTVTMGIISAKGRNDIGINNYENFIQTDAAINPGNSGGPLISLHGEMIGINTAIYTRSGGYQGIGFAVPMNMARRIMDDLISNGRVSRGWLGVGIQDITKELAQVFHLADTKGVLISAVMEGMPAEKAGLHKGDIVIRLNGKKVADANTLRNRIANSRVGTTARLNILRDTKTLNLDVVLEERPKRKALTPVVAPPAPTPAEEKSPLGFSVEELSEEQANQLGFSASSGVVIKRVFTDTIAKKAGLRRGMLIQEINRHAIRNLTEFRQAMKNANPKEGVLFLISSKQGTQYVVLRIR